MCVCVRVCVSVRVWMSVCVCVYIYNPKYRNYLYYSAFKNKKMKNKTLSSLTSRVS